MVDRDKLRSAARTLAEAHARISHDDLKVFWLPGTDDVVRLVEVSARFFPAPTGSDVEAYGFAPDPAHGLHYRTEVALATPDEWDRAGRGVLKVGRGWDVRRFEPVWPVDE